MSDIILAFSENKGLSAFFHSCVLPQLADGRCCYRRINTGRAGGRLCSRACYCSAGWRGGAGGQGGRGAHYVGSFQLSNSLSPVLLSRVLCSVWMRPQPYILWSLVVAACQHWPTYVHCVATSLCTVLSSDVNKTKYLRPRPRPPEINKCTWRI